MEKENINDVLVGIQSELNRFQSRLIDYQERAKDDPGARYGCKESGALRRAALDLKNELTRITQSIGY